VLAAPGERIAFTTDSFVVTPRFFPGGDIGRLAVCGTVNDLACMGARPLALSLALVLEEGLLVSELGRVMASVRAACDEACVPIVTGDTKVVEAGSADGLYITTAGVGAVREGVSLGGRNARPGDRVLVSGKLGEHGVAVMAARHGLSGLAGLRSDCAPLAVLAGAILDAGGAGVRCMRDPTRGGLSAVVNEIAAQSGVGIALADVEGLASEATRGACELLGLDPLSLANEGKLVVIVAPECARGVLRAMQGHALGGEAADVGEVAEGPVGRVTIRTALGTSRVLSMPAGELLPRIC
jgi:hydrogenase expression/formation protein HypE